MKTQVYAMSVEAPSDKEMTDFLIALATFVNKERQHGLKVTVAPIYSHPQNTD